MSEAATRLELLDRGDVRGLFVDSLGWNKPDQPPIDLTLDGESYTLSNVASYKGIRVYQCSTLPPRRVQRLLDVEARKRSTERLIIFCDAVKQDWRWPQSRDDKGSGPPRLVTHEHYIGRRTDALLQRLDQIEIGLDEDPTVPEVVGRLRRAFDAEKITKAFFKRFVEHQTSLTSAIQGRLRPEERDWYGSLLMNRLMFIYFMQRKGFMDGDPHYLRTRLHQVQALNGPNSFYEFYRDFLIPLFHEGLGKPGVGGITPRIAEIVGDVPYVNGGIFAPHEVEAADKAISVPDSAFLTVFDLFDGYQWHLDDRPTGNPNEINPDVLGYIFEQFINRKEAGGNDKGAFYTPEDVSTYMTAAVILPLFLERLQEATGINPWFATIQDPDRFVWQSMKHGLHLALPDSLTGDGEFSSPLWSDRADNARGLPGETWWEVWDRRAATEESLNALRNGRVNSVREAVTRNLDLESIAIDVIDRIDNPQHVAVAWRLLTEMKVLDPTCGSGAFLFAALRTLHGLYQAVLDAARVHAKTATDPGLTGILEAADAHPHEDYFILKHATLNNLYGVDIMPEAAEIARLRLFLRLVSVVERREDLEPLPDLDFNIKSGNTLVGAERAEDISRLSEHLDSHLTADEAVEMSLRVRDDYLNFRDAQETARDEDMRSARARLVRTIDEVRAVVDAQWHRMTGARESLGAWRRSHQPFHWFVEYPEVFERGGFDVVIGNPPYVARGKITTYRFTGFRTDSAPDIYAPLMERASHLTSQSGRMAMIVSMNLSWGPKYESLRRVLVERFPSIWLSTYAILPDGLFSPSANTRNTIVIAGPDAGGVHLSTYNKWATEFRPHLMSTQRYVRRDTIVEAAKATLWPKVGHHSLLRFAHMSPQGIGTMRSRTQHRLGYKQIAQYWLSVFVADPPALDGSRRPMPQKKVGDLYFATEDEKFAALAIATSRAAFMWWVFHGDEFDVTQETFNTWPVRPSTLSKEDYARLVDAGKRLDAVVSVPGDHWLWTPYAGAWQGNFDYLRLRHLTEEADTILRPYLSLDTPDAWRDFNVEYARFLKMGRERPGICRGALPDRDRT